MKKVDFGPLFRGSELLPLREVRSKYDSGIAIVPDERTILDMWSEKYKLDRSIVEDCEDDDEDDEILKRNRMLLKSRFDEISRRRRGLVSENRRRVQSLVPMYGYSLRHLIKVVMKSETLSSLFVRSYIGRLKYMESTICRFMLRVPPART